MTIHMLMYSISRTKRINLSFIARVPDFSLSCAFRSHRIHCPSTVTRTQQYLQRSNPHPPFRVLTQHRMHGATLTCVRDSVEPLSLIHSRCGSANGTVVTRDVALLPSL